MIYRHIDIKDEKCFLRGKTGFLNLETNHSKRESYGHN